MNINVEWEKLIYLKDGSKEGAIFKYPEDDLPEEAGCYVFFNQLRQRRKIIYIGKANNIRSRLKIQFNSIKLMNGIKDSGRGNKVLIYCTIKLRPGQRLERVIAILEKNLIKHAFLEGHELLNVHGAKIHFHEINFKGNRTSQSLFGTNILSPTQ